MTASSTTAVSEQMRSHDKLVTSHRATRGGEAIVPGVLFQVAMLRNLGAIIRSLDVSG